jgi:hypothetical protein
VSERAGIQKDEFDLITPGLLNAVDDFVLGVALKAVQLVSGLRRLIAEFVFDIAESGPSINIGFAIAQQIQIRTIDQ